jgi:transcriptional regulator with XRE-family HTH domain
MTTSARTSGFEPPAPPLPRVIPARPRCSSRNPVAPGELCGLLGFDPGDQFVFRVDDSARSETKGWWPLPMVSVSPVAQRRLRHPDASRDLSRSQQRHASPSSPCWDSTDAPTFLPCSSSTSVWSMHDLGETVQSFEERFGSRMREYRLDLGLTQGGFVRVLAAYGLSLDASAISRIEKGVRAVRLGEAHVISRAFGLELDDFLRSGMTDVEEFRAARDMANRAMRSGRSNIVWMLRGFQRAGRVLDRNPSVSDSLEVDEFERPRDSQAYFEWATKRMATLAKATWALHDDSHIPVESLAEAEALSKLAAQLAANMTSIYSAVKDGEEEFDVEHSAVP